MLKYQNPIYRRRREASEYLRARYGFRCAIPTLAKLACSGGGPRFVHAGRYPLYPEDELDAWARSRISPLRTSTADAGSDGLVVSQKKTGAANNDFAEVEPAPGTPPARAVDHRIRGRDGFHQNQNFLLPFGDDSDLKSPCSTDHPGAAGAVQPTVDPPVHGGPDGA